MAIDEQLISRRNQDTGRDKSAANVAPSFGLADGSGVRSSSLREEIQRAKNGLPPASNGDLRADRIAAMRQKNLKGKADQALEAALSPANESLKNLLRGAWSNLIPTFGFSLLWIDLHFLLNMVFGKKLFCDLGEEWIPAKPSVSSIVKK